MQPTVTVSSSGDLSYVGSAAKSLDGDNVYVGIPERETRRRAKKFIGPLTEADTYRITNAGLLYIHTNGSPKWKIPPRPVIEPAINAHKDRIFAMMVDAAAEKFNGKTKESKKKFDLVGQFASNKCKEWFTDPRNGWPQNTRDVIRRKLRKLKDKKGHMTKRHKQWLAAEAIIKSTPKSPLYGTTPLDKINTPLIDTGQLRRAITWVSKVR